MTSRIILVLIFVCFIQMTSLALAAPKGSTNIPPPALNQAQRTLSATTNGTILNNDKTECKDLENCTQYYSICEDHFKPYTLIYCRKFCDLCSECVILNEHPVNGTLTLNYTNKILNAAYDCDMGFYPSGGNLERNCSMNTSNSWTGSKLECSPVLTEKCNGSTNKYCKRVPHAGCSGTDQNGTCECKQGFEHSNNLTTCLEVYKNTDCDDFNSSSTCKNLAHSICVQMRKQSTMPSPSPMSTTTNPSRKGRCECKEGFSYNQSAYSCYKVLNNSCAKNSTCNIEGKVEHSYCDNTTGINPVCKCKDGFAEKDYLCVQVIGSSCNLTHSDICKKTANAQCSSREGECQCISGFYLSNSLCIEVYSRNCTHDGNCSRNLSQSKCYKDLSSTTQSLETTISSTPSFGQCFCNEGYYYNNQTHSCDIGCKLPSINYANFSEVNNTKLYRQGDDVNYTCNEGYEFEGYNGSQKTINCTVNGIFNTIRNCSIKHCGNLNNPEHGNASMSNGDVFESVATFSCIEGYTLNGVNNTKCEADGTWAQHDVKCIINKCESLTVPEHVKFNMTNGKDYQSVATFYCNEGYTLTGNKTTTCQANETWKKYNVTCTIKDCGPPTISDGYGNATDNVTTYDSTAIYKCNAGYKLVGKNTSRCNESGEWENVPVCNRKDCGNLTDVENGTANMLNGTVFESVANFSCNKGYTLHGYNEITCTDTGTWAQHNVTCTIKNCGSPTISEGYGNATNNVTTYNSTALYTCNKGFELVGKNTSICNESGKWENVPVCKRKNCGNLTDVENGTANMLNGTVFESVANFSCNKGYTLFGYNEITCTYNGTWAQHNVTCIIKDCGDPIKPNNGNYTLDDENTVFNHSATYKCDLGYKTNETTVVRCNSFGNWSHPPPVCYDINECSNQSWSNCSTEGSQCINNPGSFSCQCFGGWTGEKCYTDIDECARYTAKCHPRASCTNTIGHYTCKCYDGFKDISPRGQIGTECQDIDECSDQILSNCSSVGSDCINFQGGYFCRCNIGWTGEKCDTDIDECNVTSTCGKKATCKNSDGGYNCTCNEGYPKGDPKIHCYQEVIIKLETQVSPSRGDNELIASKPIHYRFPYFDDEYSTFRPNMDGFLSLGYQPIYEAYGPESSDAWKTFSGSHTVVAPFWTNIDTTNLTGGLYTHLFEKYTNYGPNDSQHRDLLALGKIFSDNLTGFKPRVAIVATWLNVTKSSYIEPIRLIKTQNATMQVILISDGVYSYLMFNYDHEQWSLQKDSGIPSSAGYSLQDKTGYIIATSANFSQLNNETNTGTGLNGRWIYNVSSNDLNIISKLKNESQCLEFRSNETIKDWITKKRGLSYPCPCSQQQMDLDYSYQVVDPWYKKTSPSPTCYEAWFFNNDGVRQTCCYSYGALKKDTGGGFATFENDRYNVVDYFYKCCDENTDRHLCHLFYEMNPSDDCTRFQPADEPVQRKRRFFVGYKRNKSG